MANSKTRLGRGLGGLISGGGTKPQTGTGIASVGKANAQRKADAASAAAAAKRAAKRSPGKGKAKPEADAKTKAKAAPVASPTKPPTSVASSMPNLKGYQEIDLSELRASPYQPRREIAPETVEDLARSIQSEGLLQPIVVRKVGSHFELIAGERRWRAYEHLSQKRIPARIIEASDASAAALALIENLQREGLNPIDEALGYASLLRDFDLTQEAVAERVGKGRATIANALRLLALGTEIQGYLSRKLISVGHAKVLLGLENEDHRKLLARRIVESGMSVREAEHQVKRLRENRSVQRPGSKNANAQASDGTEETVLRDLEKRIGEYFNTRVAIKHSPKQGKLIIDYFGNDDLDRILDKIGVPS